MLDDNTQTRQQSRAADIRDAAVDLINGLGIMNAIRKAPTFQWQPEDQTACGVYVLRVSKTALGDYNACRDFQVDAVIGVSVLVRVTDPDDLADATERYVDPVERAMLTSPEFDQLFEGVTTISRTPAFPPNGSAYMSETRFEFEFGFKENWSPADLPLLNGLDVTAPSDRGDAPVPVKARIAFPHT